VYEQYWIFTHLHLTGFYFFSCSRNTVTRLTWQWYNAQNNNSNMRFDSWSLKMQMRSGVSTALKMCIMVFKMETSLNLSGDYQRSQEHVTNVGAGKSMMGFRARGLRISRPIRSVTILHTLWVSFDKISSGYSVINYKEIVFIFNSLHILSVTRENSTDLGRNRKQKNESTHTQKRTVLQHNVFSTGIYRILAAVLFPSDFSLGSGCQD
jgi:hypothetical protein